MTAKSIQQEEQNAKSDGVGGRQGHLYSSPLSYRPLPKPLSAIQVNGVVGLSAIRSLKPQKTRLQPEGRGRGYRRRSRGRGRPFVELGVRNEEVK